MAARLDPRHDARTRAKIQTSQLINRLKDHVFGKVELSPTQVRAAEVLLRKSLPDLQNVTLSGDADNPVRFEAVRRLIIEPGHTDSESISTPVEPSSLQGSAWGERVGEEPFLRRLDDRRRDH
jgi:hypothetical protein